MDRNSVTRPSPPSTKAIVADEGFCAQVAALLLCDLGSIHDAFIGEPAEEVLEMVRWARKRGRGAWSGRLRPPQPKERDPYEELARALASYWAEHPGDLTALLDRAEASANGRSA